MLRTTLRLLPDLPLFVLIAVATHLAMSFARTLMHYKLGHHPMGGMFFRNHSNFHHALLFQRSPCFAYAPRQRGNNTPYFFIPMFLLAPCLYIILPFRFFLVLAVACAISFLRARLFR